jgi:hypothetical protein
VLVTCHHQHDYGSAQDWKDSRQSRQDLMCAASACGGLCTSDARVRQELLVKV